MRVLGIESSCDETGVALYDSEHGLLAHALFSQIDLHADYGGVVPELASRDHVRRLIPLMDEIFEKAGCDKSSLDAIAYTAGPGLMGALMVGAAVGRSMAWSLGIPAIGVHHMEGHLLAPMLEETPPEFPFLALLVSGGHTQLYAVEGIGKYELLGESLDDAAGEAFDKTAQLLGLGYPGGPAVAKAALEGDSSAYKFPRPMTNRPGLDFSFSGLKTFVLTTWENSDKSEPTRANIACAFQDAVVDTLLIKCRRALEQTGYKRLVIAGGVSANRQLRETLETYGKDKGVKIFYPRTEFCTDNGAMIAFAGCQRLMAGQQQGNGFNTYPRWPMTELDAV